MRKISQRYIYLDIYSEFFQAIKSGSKTFEIRRNRYDYQVGDILVLSEINEYTKEYTGQVIRVNVTYITDYGQQENYVVMSIEKRV